MTEHIHTQPQDTMLGSALIVFLSFSVLKGVIRGVTENLTAILKHSVANLIRSHNQRLLCDVLGEQRKAISGVATLLSQYSESSRTGKFSDS